MVRRSPSGRSVGHDRQVESSASVVNRLGRLLRAVAACEPDGSSTTALAVSVNLPRPTVHRLLAALQREGLVERDEATAAWHVGPECFLLGAAATARHDVTPVARASVRKLALDTGESAFFSVRRGDETICLLREDGSFPVRSHVLHEGIRFPLGVASAGLVILSFLPEREREECLSGVDRGTAFGPEHATEEIRARVAETRARGYAINPGLIVPGSWGLGAAVFDGRGYPAWALSLTGIESRLAPPRQDDLGQVLLREAHHLARLLRDPASGRR